MNFRSSLNLILCLTLSLPMPLAAQNSYSTPEMKLVEGILALQGAKHKSKKDRESIQKRATELQLAYINDSDFVPELALSRTAEALAVYGALDAKTQRKIENALSESQSFANSVTTENPDRAALIMAHSAERVATILNEVQAPVAPKYLDSVRECFINGVVFLGAGAALKIYSSNWLKNNQVQVGTEFKLVDKTTGLTEEVPVYGPKGGSNLAKVGEVVGVVAMVVGVIGIFGSPGCDAQ
jgi:hypothetical protein